MILKKKLGKGTFKTAILALLEFESSQVPEIGLGSFKVNGQKLIPIALKSPFIEEPISKLGWYGRKAKAPTKEKATCEVCLLVVDEQHAITREANLLIWGNSLLRFAYN